MLVLLKRNMTEAASRHHHASGLLGRAVLSQEGEPDTHHTSAASRLASRSKAAITPLRTPQGAAVPSLCLPFCPRPRGYRACCLISSLFGWFQHSSSNKSEPDLLTAWNSNGKSPQEVAWRMGQPPSWSPETVDGSQVTNVRESRNHIGWRGDGNETGLSTDWLHSFSHLFNHSFSKYCLSPTLFRPIKSLRIHPEQDRHNLPHLTWSTLKARRIIQCKHMTQSWGVMEGFKEETSKTWRMHEA